MNFFSKLFFAAALPVAAVLFFTTPQVSAHDDERRERFSDSPNDAHRQGHRDLRNLHSEFHEYPSTRREHKRFHRQLRREHRNQHRELSDWRNDYRRQNRYWDWRTNGDRWGQWSRDDWQGGYREYNRYDRDWRFGRN